MAMPHGLARPPVQVDRPAAAVATPPSGPDITASLYGRFAAHPKFMDQSRAIQSLAACMAEQPAEVLPRFVALALELTEATSAGLSLLEDGSGAGRVPLVLPAGYVHAARGVRSFRATTAPAASRWTAMHRF